MLIREGYQSDNTGSLKHNEMQENTQDKTYLVQKQLSTGSPGVKGTSLHSPLKCWSFTPRAGSMRSSAAVQLHQGEQLCRLTCGSENHRSLYY